MYVHSQVPPAKTFSERVTPQVPIKKQLSCEQRRPHKISAIIFLAFTCLSYCVLDSELTQVRVTPATQVRRCLPHLSKFSPS